MTHLQKILAYAASRAATLSLTGALALLSGCATIVGDEHASLPIKSTPADAQILIIDEAGRTAYRGRTPDQVPLRKSDGHYWGGKQFTVAISKRGYLTPRIKVDTRPNALYLGGKMYDLASAGIDITLQQRPDEDAAARPAEPRPYWPTPPALPVSPSTAAPQVSSQA